MWSRRHFLGGAGAGLLSALASPARGGRSGGPHLVIVLARGGWDTTMCLDPRLGASGIDGPDLDEDPDIADDTESVVLFGASPVAVNPFKRPHVRRFFTRWGPRTAVVNGIAVDAVSHLSCQRRVLTGHDSGSHPDAAAIVGATHGAACRLPTLDSRGLGTPGPLAGGTGVLGSHAQLGALLDGRPPVEEGHRDAIRSYLEARSKALQAARGSERVDGYDEAARHAAALHDHGPTLAGLLRVGRRTTPSALAYPLAVLLADGTVHSAIVDSQRFWDTHADNVAQHASYDLLFRDLDRLLRALDHGGVLDRTVVVVLSEMGRTPQLNHSLGKDHWPVTSAMVIGAGVAGGRTYGATGGRLEPLPVDFATGEIDRSGRVVTARDFVAGLLVLLEVDPVPWLGRVAGFSPFAA